MGTHYIDSIYSSRSSSGAYRVGVFMILPGNNNHIHSMGYLEIQEDGTIDPSKIRQSVYKCYGLCRPYIEAKVQISKVQFSKADDSLPIFFSKGYFTKSDPRYGQNRLVVSSLNADGTKTNNES